MKRGGGRRYYRPEDVELLRGIHHLLRSQAYTIKGVQRILRDQGVEFVKSCWQPGGRPVGAPDPSDQDEAHVRKPRGTRSAGEAETSGDAPLVAGKRRKAGVVAVSSSSRSQSPQDRATIKSAIDQLEVARQSLAGTRAVAKSAAADVPAGASPVAKAGRSKAKPPAEKRAVKRP